MVKLLGETFARSDCDHLKQLRLLEKVMFQTHQVKVGRGKSATYVDRFRWTTKHDDEVRENILYSIKIFKKRCLNSENTNGES